MQNVVKPLALMLLLAASGSAWAQDSTTEDTAPTEEEAPAAEAADGDFSFGEPVTREQLEGLQPGQFYILETFADWAIRCVKTPEGQADPCQLYQLLQDENGNAVAEVNIFPLPEGGRAVAGANIVAPLETLLTQQLTLSVDGGSARRYPFTFCNAGGCVARVGFTQEEIDQFKRGNAAQIVLVPAAAPEQPIRLTMSLSGFTAGLDGTYDIPR